MKKLRKLMLFIPLLSLTSCGFSLNYIVEGNKYNSPVFNENYYQHWDSDLKNAKEGINQKLSTYITKFSDLYTLDPNVLLEGYTNADDYGADYKMNKVNDMFNYAIDNRHKGNGYMTEALEAVKHYCLNKLNANRIYGGCEINNIASKRVMEKCNFKFEGTLRNYLKLQDGYHDLHIYSFIKDRD